MADFGKTVPYRRRKGVLRFFQLIRDNYWDLILLNMAFTLTALPAFTLGASLAALNRVTLKMARDEPGAYIKEYFRAFKGAFTKEIISGLSFAAALFVTGFAFLFYYSNARAYPLMYPAAAAALSAFLIILSAGAFYYPCAALSRGKKATVMSALLLCARGGGRTALALFAFSAYAFIIWALLPYSAAVLPFFPVSRMALAVCCAASGSAEEESINNK